MAFIILRIEGFQSMLLTQDGGANGRFCVGICVAALLLLMICRRNVSKGIKFIHGLSEKLALVEA